MAEPLVDVVDANQIATTTSQLLSVDIRSATKEDATFKVGQASFSSCVLVCSLLLVQLAWAWLV